MKKYLIAKDVDVEKSESIVEKRNLPVNALALGALVVNPFALMPVLCAVTVPKIMSKDVTRIASLEELNEYSCVDSEWKKECYYVEHPKVPKRLIEAAIYKDYILKEMMAEIFDYITDSIPVKKIVLGLETKNKLEGGVAVPIESVVVDASLSGSLDSNYLCTMEDVECCKDEKRDYVWMKYYPDIVAAVKKKSGKLEKKQSVKMNLDVGLGISGVLKGALNFEQEYNFYVYYVKA